MKLISRFIVLLTFSPFFFSCGNDGNVDSGDHENSKVPDVDWNETDDQKSDEKDSDVDRIEKNDQENPDHGSNGDQTQDDEQTKSENDADTAHESSKKTECSNRDSLPSNAEWDEQYKDGYFNQTWDGEKWIPVEKICSWSCSENYQLSDDRKSCEPSARKVLCSNKSDLPVNADWDYADADGSVTQKWDVNLEKFIPSNDPCPWRCRSGFQLIDGKCHQVGNSCDDAVPVVLDSNGEFKATGTTEGMSNSFQGSCAGGCFGPDAVYLIELDESRFVEVEINTDLEFDMALHIKKGCMDDDMECSDAGADGENEMISLFLPAGKYYIIADGYGKTMSGKYEISIRTSNICGENPGWCSGSGGECRQDSMESVFCSCTEGNASNGDSSDPQCVDDVQAIGNSCLKPLAIEGESFKHSYSTEAVTDLLEIDPSCDEEKCLTGRDVVYSFTLEKRSYLNISLDADFRNSFYVTKNCGSREILKSGDLAGVYEPGDYFIVIDGKNRFEYGNYTLSFNVNADPCAKVECSLDHQVCVAEGDTSYRCVCRDGFFKFNGNCMRESTFPGNSCDSAIAINIDKETKSWKGSGSTKSHSDASKYRAGNDSIYVLEIEDTAFADIKVGSDDNYDTYIYLLESCGDSVPYNGMANDEATVPGYFRASRVRGVLEKGTYYVVVDGYRTSDKGKFELSVSLHNPCLKNPCGSGICLVEGDEAYSCNCEDGLFFDGKVCMDPCAGKSCGEYAAQEGCVAESSDRISCSCQGGYAFNGDFGNPACVPSVCGNGKVEAAEVCDGGSRSCSEFGNFKASGKAGCYSDCSGYDISSCEPFKNLSGMLNLVFDRVDFPFILDDGMMGSSEYTFPEEAVLAHTTFTGSMGDYQIPGKGGADQSYAVNDGSIVYTMGVSMDYAAGDKAYPYVQTIFPDENLDEGVYEIGVTPGNVKLLVMDKKNMSRCIMAVGFGNISVSDSEYTHLSDGGWFSLENEGEIALFHPSATPLGDIRPYLSNPSACNETTLTCGNGEFDPIEVCEAGMEIECSELKNEYASGKALCKSDCEGYDESSCRYPDPCVDNPCAGVDNAVGCIDAGMGTFQCDCGDNFIYNGDYDNPACVEVEKVQKEWTLMIYLDGDNDLETYSLADFNEMEEGLSRLGPDSENLNVIVLLDRNEGYNQRPTEEGGKNWTDTRIYRVLPDENPIMFGSERLDDGGKGIGHVGNLREKNMGDPETMNWFLNFSKKNFPAEKYGLVMWNHGGGTRSPEWGKPSGTKAICWDEDNGNDTLYLDEIQQSVSRNFSRDEKLDFIGFDACLMAMVEVGYEFRNLASFMTASMNTEQGGGWDYRTILGGYKKGMSAAELSVHAVGMYRDYIESAFPLQDTGETLSATDLSKIEEVAEAVNNLGSAIFYENKKREIEILRDETVHFYDSDMASASYPFFDLHDFAGKVLSDTKNGFSDELKSSASAVIESLRNAVMASFGDKGNGQEFYFKEGKDAARGLSLFISRGEIEYSGKSHYLYQYWYTDQDTKELYGDGFEYGHLDFCSMNDNGKIDSWKELMHAWYFHPPNE